MPRNRALQAIMRSFHPDSLLGRVSLVFLTAVTLPTVLLIALVVSQAQTATQQEAMSDARRIHAELHSRLEDDTARFQAVASQLSYNSRIRTFLDRPYRFVAEDVLVYRRSIYPLLNLAAQLVESTWNAVSVYYENESVPEAWPYLFRASRVGSESWYSRLRDGAAHAVWLSPYDARVRSAYLTRTTSQPVFAYARRIGSLVADDFLGAVIVMIPEQRMYSVFENFAQPTMAFAIADSTGTVVHSSTENSDTSMSVWSEGALSLLQDPARDEFELVDGGKLYRARRISLLDGWMISRTDLTAAAFARNGWTWAGYLVLILAVGLVQILTYRFLNRLLRRLGHVSRIMHIAAEGDLEQHVLDERADEIGQVGRDFNYMIGRIKALMQQTVERETAQKSAQLQALQYQINPHFIHNTLDVLRMQLALEGSTRVADSLASFGSMLRYNMSGNPEVTVDDEVHHVYEYMEVQRLRFDDDVHLEMQLGPECLNTPILKFVLQPLVENAITHGYRDDGRTMTIRLRGRAEEGIVALFVEDDGVGMSDERLREVRDVLDGEGGSVSGSSEAEGSSLRSRRLGLANIHRRLRLHYGKRAGLRVRSQAGEGTSIEVVLPCER